MAKVISPLFSIEARGQFGKALVFSKWKDILYCRKYVIPSNPNTTAQNQLRQYFTQAVATWNGETTATKTAWNQYCTEKGYSYSGYNLYIKAYVTFMRTSNGVPPAQTATPPQMT